MSELGQMTVVRSILTDSSQGTNLLGSWLGNNPSWLASLFPEKTRKQFTVEEACAGIVGINNENGVGICSAPYLVSFHRPSSHAQRSRRRCSVQTWWTTYTGILYWRCSHRCDGLAASHVRSEVRARIEAQILTAAAKFDDAELEAEKKEMVSDLIVAGLVGCTGGSPTAKRGRRRWQRYSSSWRKAIRLRCS